MHHHHGGQATMRWRPKGQIDIDRQLDNFTVVVMFLVVRRGKGLLCIQPVKKREQRTTTPQILNIAATDQRLLTQRERLGSDFHHRNHLPVEHFYIAHPTHTAKVPAENHTEHVRLHVPFAIFGRGCFSFTLYPHCTTAAATTITTRQNDNIDVRIRQAKVNCRRTINMHRCRRPAMCHRCSNLGDYDTHTCIKHDKLFDP